MHEQIQATTRTRKLLYWVTTGLAAFTIAAIGAADLMRAPQVVAGVARLGYPAVLTSILGAWQLLGVAAILAPGLARLKEWAYAGFFYTLTGAAISHASAGDSIGHIVFPLVLLGLVISSYSLKSSRGAVVNHDLTGAQVV
jgi:DoxX-like family